jgi:replicative DNA helicase
MKDIMGIMKQAQAMQSRMQEMQAEMERVFGLAELIVAKQRHGSTGKVRLKFEAKVTRFSDLAPDQMGAYSYGDD